MAWRRSQDVPDGDQARLWRADGARFIDAGKDIAILVVETSEGPVASRTGVAIHHIVAAQTGELLGEYDGPRNRRPVAGDGVAAYTSAGVMTIVSPTATRSFPVANITQTARVVVVQDGIVVTDQPGTSGRVIRGFDLANGAELWRRSTASFGSNSTVGTFSAYTDDGPIELDLQNGDTNALWSDVVRDGVVEASVAELIELLAPGPVRHFRHGAGTIAIDEASGDVLWSDPSRYPVAAAEDVAVFRSPDEYEIVKAETGEKLATVGRGEGSSVAVSEGRVLIVSEGRVSVVDTNGGVEQIAKLRTGARASAISGRYALVIVRRSPTSKRQAVVFDMATGEQLARHRVNAFSQVRIEVDRVVLHHSADSDTVIDLTTSEASRVDTGLFGPRPAGVRQLAAVFDASRQRLLWKQNLDHPSTVGTIGDAVVVIRTGSKRSGVIKYPELES